MDLRSSMISMDKKLRFKSSPPKRRQRRPVAPVHISAASDTPPIEVPVNTLKNWMEDNGHSRIDVLKIDIEGSEYRILDDILKYQDKIAGLVIEFHNVDLHKDIISDFLKKFNLSLCHIHGQNPSGTDYLDKNNDPTQVEMTFSNSKNILSTNPKIPHLLDQPADFRFQDVELNFVD